MSVVGAIIEAISKATEEDLRELDTQISEAKKKLASLISARQILTHTLWPKEDLLGVVCPNNPQSQEQGQPTQNGKRIPKEFCKEVVHLISVNGPMPAKRICKATGYNNEEVEGWMGNLRQYFEKESDGYHLTNAAHTAFLSKYREGQ